MVNKRPKVKILAFSAHKDYMNLYTNIGECRYRFQLQRGLVFNRLSPTKLQEFLDDHNFEFNDKVYCLLGTANSMPDLVESVEVQVVSTLRFHLMFTGHKVLSLSQKRIRQVYAPLSIGWRNKPTKTLIEMGYHSLFGKEKYIESLKDTSITYADMTLMYIAHQHSLFLSDEGDNE